MLTIEQVTKSYAKGNVKAVDDLSLTILDGEIFGFIGPNGAGKTTTIRMITGILRPDTGKITVNGHDIVKEPVEAKKTIGFVPDDQVVYDRLTGMEYLHFLADIYGVPAQVRKERIEKYLSMFEMEKAAGDKLNSYSHGMRQKIILTGALLSSPALWLLDEPLTGLDPRAAHLLKEEMRAHCAKGNTVFFSTHVLDVAERLCDRVGIINKGKLIAVGTMEELRGSEKKESLEDIFLELTGEEKEAD
jgi:ABC-2 type transport system ATP-binding protein